MGRSFAIMVLFCGCLPRPNDNDDRIRASDPVRNAYQIDQYEISTAANVAIELVSIDLTGSDGRDRGTVSISTIATAGTQTVRASYGDDEIGATMTITVGEEVGTNFQRLVADLLVPAKLSLRVIATADGDQMKSLRLAVPIPVAPSPSPHPSVGGGISIDGVEFYSFDVIDPDGKSADPTQLQTWWHELGLDREAATPAGILLLVLFDPAWRDALGGSSRSSPLTSSSGLGVTRYALTWFDCLVQAGVAGGACLGCLAAIPSGATVAGIPVAAGVCAGCYGNEIKVGLCIRDLPGDCKDEDCAGIGGPCVGGEIGKCNDKKTYCICECDPTRCAQDFPKSYYRFPIEVCTSECQTYGTGSSVCTASKLSICGDGDLEDALVGCSEECEEGVEPTCEQSRGPGYQCKDCRCVLDCSYKSEHWACNAPGGTPPADYCACLQCCGIDFGFQTTCHFYCQDTCRNGDFTPPPNGC
jgi:hypothetical protein